MRRYSVTIRVAGNACNPMVTVTPSAAPQIVLNTHRAPDADANLTSEGRVGGIVSASDAALKRGFDLLFSSLGLVVLSPLLVIIGAAIKLSSKGPVLYSGVRVGREGKPFEMLKFRTMVTNAEAIGGSSTPEDDPRVTRVGRFLRRGKLDELPQLLNVVAGSMSFVGPRPQVQWAVDRYTPEERLVLSVRPGITDYASLRFANEGEILKGSTDPDKDYMEKIHPEKMRLSLEYIRNRSFRRDLSIIAQTLGAVFKPTRN
jgi:lipopolysaccharide/colanic/teichoic acid biosynthesis glycosyltransferase